MWAPFGRVVWGIGTIRRKLLPLAPRTRLTQAANIPFFIAECVLSVQAWEEKGAYMALY